MGIAELASGLVSRKFGRDVLLLPMTPQGIPQWPITFYHTSKDCSGERYLRNNGGVLAFFGQYLGGTIFYTRLSDWLFPPLPEDLHSEEVINVGSDPMGLGVCTTYDVGQQQSVGEAIPVTDLVLNSMVAPLRLK